MEIFVVAIVIGLLPAVIASSKGRSFFLWWLYGSALFIIAIIHALVIKPTPTAERSEKLEQGMKPCHFCAEMIQGAALVCRFCNRDQPPPKTMQDLFGAIKTKDADQ